jgi:nicotinamidase-related amidase
VEKARASQVPVVWVQHSDEELAKDSDEWQYVPELVRQDDEPLVHKHYGDSFEDTDLESVLAERGVGRLLVTGARPDRRGGEDRRGRVLSAGHPVATV